LLKPFLPTVFLCCSLLAEESSLFDFPLTQTHFSSLPPQEKRGWGSYRIKADESSFMRSFIRTDKGAIFHGHVEDSEFKWDWGARSGVRYNGLEEDWHLAATYTHFHSRSFASLQKEGKIQPVWDEIGSLSPGEFKDLARSSWRLDLDIADLEFGKAFVFQDVFSFRPHLGVRSTWIYQKFDIDDENDFGNQPVEDPAYWNNCLAIGARSGVDTFWTLGKRLKVFGDGAFSFLSGYHNVHQRQSFMQMRSSLQDLNPALGFGLVEFSLGLQYDRTFEKPRSFMSMRLGYEVNYFLNQGEVVDWFQPFAQGGIKQMISLEGLSASFHLDF
jgi:hypothetical protein